MAETYIVETRGCLTAKDKFNTDVKCFDAYEEALEYWNGQIDKLTHAEVGWTQNIYDPEHNVNKGYRVSISGDKDKKTDLRFYACKDWWTSGYWVQVILNSVAKEDKPVITTTEKTTKKKATKARKKT